MGRKYKRKTEIGLLSHEAMLAAVREVVEKDIKIRTVAKEKGIPKSTLQRYVRKYKNHAEAVLAPNYTHSLVFTKEQEENLSQYLLNMSRMFHGLTKTQVKQLAFELTQKKGLPAPTSWVENKAAGNEWLSGFLERNPQLSVRTPEATSLARARAFNELTMKEYFSNLENLLQSTKVNGARIFNLDESGCTTVQKVPKVIGEKGVKQVGQITSRERGELVTICGIVSASGIALPPAFVFPRKRFREVFLAGAPEGTLALVSDSGWMNSTIFIKVIEHVVANTKPNKEDPIVLVLDNHESHLSLDVLEYAESHGVHILTLPPHTSHKTQPLDRCVFGPMKKFFNDECNSWMMRHPGKSISIYEMGSLIGAAWIKAATPQNIISGFRVSGIWPFDKNIFSPEEFLPASVHDASYSNDARSNDVGSNPGLPQDVDFIPSYPKVNA